MKNPPLFRTLVQALRKQGRTQADIDKFEARWRNLRAQDAHLCPLCYLDRNEEQQLAALPAIADVEPVRCPACREQFDIPIPR
jgi:hypothetical protein